jgi:hypothetical protein
MVVIQTPQKSKEGYGMKTVEKTEEEKVGEVLAENSPFSKDVKRQIQRARKPPLRTVQHYLCDRCDEMISRAEDGFIIHGNIYTADPSCCGGLIGNNFPVPSGEPGQMFVLDQVQKTVLCKRCFSEALGLKPKTSIRKPRDIRCPEPDNFPYSDGYLPLVPDLTPGEDIPF